ncbi:signal peptidase II [Kineosporia sp. R_H_3]|uniref:signal peptidase II n=1 Tax=Kineosporia sp. R_H_3 TaxID=1961848 RepID=UPI0018E96667|nr:signal peptidase II [Kineosporia sp. R_H_3]
MRTRMLAAVGVLAGVNLTVKAVVEARLADTNLDLGLIELRLTYNKGVAFSVGNWLPPWVIIAVTGAITATIGVSVWRAAPAAGRATRLAGAALVAGAVSNLADRIGDGVVTDYVHTGWWPTFNLADTMLCAGVTGLILASLRGNPRGRPGA